MKHKQKMWKILAACQKDAERDEAFSRLFYMQAEKRSAAFWVSLAFRVSALSRLFCLQSRKAFCFELS